MTVTIAIKAYNEEAHIALAIESALAALAELGGGFVVLGDCASTDATQEIALRYPVRILTLAMPEERSCGAGAQLAYQGVETEFFYLMDGDMTLLPGFLPQALAWLHAHPELAGVGGNVRDRYLDNAEFRIRAASAVRETHRRAGEVDRLDGGALYRREAIRSIGYFANPGLYSYEEFDLAARLATAGWKMARIDVDAVLHSGHRIDSFSLLWYRFSSGQLGGAGNLLRAALGRPHWFYTLRNLRQVQALVAVMVWWLSLVGTFWAARLDVMAGLMGAPIAFLVFRRRSILLGLYSFLYWNLTALAMLRGFFCVSARTRHDEMTLAFHEFKGGSGDANQ